VLELRANAGSDLFVLMAFRRVRRAFPHPVGAWYHIVMQARGAFHAARARAL